MQSITSFPIGYDHDDYYSGDQWGDPKTSMKVENFARQIKESVTDKEKFINCLNIRLLFA